MALSALTSVQSAVSKLFSKLPDRIFAPLASENRHRYWALLCYLHDKRFGPNAPIPPVKGYPVKEIIQDIVDEIELQEAWSDEESILTEATIEQRARAIFERLHSCGWFRIENPRFDRRVSMHPTVRQFLDLVIDFAEADPVFLSGKIRIIDTNLKTVVDGTASGDVFSETAKQARDLLEHVRNTGTNIHDFMEELSREKSTAQYVQRFFTDYIEQVFIGDYKELRTKEHPLSRRRQILENVERLLESTEPKQQVMEWYESRLAKGNREKAKRLFERDIQRLNDLSRIDEYLERLDDEIRKANKRAFAYLDYRLRSMMPSEHLVRLAIQSAIGGGIEDMADPFPPGEMVNPEGLREPRKAITRSEPSALRKIVVSEEHRAMASILNRAREARQVSPVKLANFALDQMKSKESIGNEELTIEGVSDARMYQTLSVLSLQMSAKGYLLKSNAQVFTKGFRVKRSGEEEVPHPFISSAPFSLEKRKPDNKSEKDHE